MAKTPKPEPTHRHTGSCYSITKSCVTNEHTHSGNACYYSKGDKAGQLKCSRTEHTHSRSSCYSPTGPLCGHP